MKHIDFTPHKCSWDMNDYGIFLEDNGFRQIGSGASSNVYAPKSNDSEYVVKVTELRTRISNDPTLSFIKTILQDEANPFYPHIHSVTIHNPVNTHENKYAVIVMEHLTKTKQTSRPLPKNANIAGELYCLFKHDFRYVATLCLGNHIPFVRAMTSIRKLTKRHVNDLHSTNIMWRGEQLVITDPVC